MPVHNADIAEVFNELADLLEIQEANPFRVRAYQNAARTVAGLPRDAAQMLHDHEDLTELPGIGKDLAGKIQEIVDRGTLSLLKEARRDTPGELPAMMKLPGLGAKRVKLIYDKLGIKTLKGLAKAVKCHRLQNIRGFGPKTEQQILEQLGEREGREERFKLSDAIAVGESLLAYLKTIPGVKQAAIAGSYRRQRETVGDLDLLATCSAGSPVMERFAKYDEIKKVLARGQTKSTVQLRSGLQVDLRVVADASYGAALHYFTGSKEHNIAIRNMGVKKKLKINEYGVFRGKKRIAGHTEEEVYKQVGLPYIEPEMRENRGEIEAAKKHALPKLITIDDLRGDLHSHTTATDGKFTLREMAEAAKVLGYDYLAITDHSQSVAMAKGLNEKRLGQQIKEIEKLNAKLCGIRLLKGCEVDILADGSLDLEDSILKELDLTVCSIHSKFNMSKEKQTERIIRAMDNPYCNIIGHPTGRLIGRRDPYEVDVQRLIDAAKERGCFLELNAQPDRLDIADAHCRLAKERGLKVAISTDAHSITDLKFMHFGIGQARRGWLESDDVINTRTWQQLKKLLKRK
jgi:DNA polymerase (family 10)